MFTWGGYRRTVIWVRWNRLSKFCPSQSHRLALQALQQVHTQLDGWKSSSGESAALTVSREEGADGPRMNPLLQDAALSLRSVGSLLLGWLQSWKVVQGFFVFILRELTWIELNWIKLNWTELNWTEINIVGSIPGIWSFHVECVGSLQVLQVFSTLQEHACQVISILFPWGSHFTGINTVKYDSMSNWRF